MGKLVGFKKFTSKAGKVYCVANVVTPYSQRELDNGYVGDKVEEMFLPDDKKELLKASDVGKDIDFVYDIVGNRAYIVDFVIK